jgi:hypothetical protein
MQSNQKQKLQLTRETVRNLRVQSSVKTGASYPASAICSNAHNCPPGPHNMI